MFTILKLIVLILFILLLVRLKVNIALILFFLIIATGLIFGFKISEFKDSIIKAFKSYYTYELLGIIIIILFLEKIMDEKEILKGIVNFFLYFKDKRWALILPPAIIGLLPMPGGALVSAPAVKIASENFKISPSEKTYINFWFRHVWEYFWPFYPGLIVASATLHVPIYKLMIYLFPLSIVSIISGLSFTIPILKEKKKNGNGKIDIKALYPLLPIGIIIILTILKINFLISLLTGIIITLFITKTCFKEVPKIFYKSLNLTIIFLVIFIMIYREIIITASIFERIQKEIYLSNVLNYLIITFISFIMGFLTGINQIYAGVAFPMLASSFKGNIDYAWVMLVYTFGFSGVLLTPAHLCLSLTKEYFKGEWKEIYKRLLPTILPVILFSIFYFFILKKFH
ncbi:MAG: DUF401 family protein [candidate division WOR-3 bacterium]